MTGLRPWLPIPGACPLARRWSCARFAPYLRSVTVSRAVIEARMTGDWCTSNPHGHNMWNNHRVSVRPAVETVGWIQGLVEHPIPPGPEWLTSRFDMNKRATKRNICTCTCFAFSIYKPTKSVHGFSSSGVTRDRFHISERDPTPFQSRHNV